MYELQYSPRQRRKQRGQGKAEIGKSLVEDGLVEAFDLVRRADAQRGALVDARDLHVEHRLTRHAIARLAARLLDEQACRTSCGTDGRWVGDRLLAGWLPGWLVS